MRIRARSQHCLLLSSYRTLSCRLAEKEKIIKQGEGAWPVCEYGQYSYLIDTPSLGSASRGIASNLNLSLSLPDIDVQNGPKLSYYASRSRP